MRFIACSFRQAAILPWSPDMSTSGTDIPRKTRGLVYWGYSSVPAANESFAADASSPRAPGRRRTTASIRNTIVVNYGSGKNFQVYSTVAYFGYNMFSAPVTGFDPASYQGGNQAPPGVLEDLFVEMVKTQ